MFGCISVLQVGRRPQVRDEYVFCGFPSAVCADIFLVAR